ncbi:hypothetical protein P7C70_g1770, partial [Phenoliferia sp. Uapishka_3]
MSAPSLEHPYASPTNKPDSPVEPSMPEVITTPATPQDPFMTDKERLENVAATATGPQKQIDPQPRTIVPSPIRSPSPPVLHISNIPQGAPRGVQLFDGPVPMYENPPYVQHEFPAPPQRFFDGPSDVSSTRTNSFPLPPHAAMAPHDHEFNRGFRYPAPNSFSPDCSHSQEQFHTPMESLSATEGVWDPQGEKGHYPSQSVAFAKLGTYEDEEDRTAWRKRLAVWLVGIIIVIIILGVAIGVGVKHHVAKKDAAAHQSSIAAGESTTQSGSTGFVSVFDTSSATIAAPTKSSTSSASAKLVTTNLISSKASEVSSALASVTSVAQSKISSLLPVVITTSTTSSPTATLVQSPVTTPITTSTALPITTSAAVVATTKPTTQEATPTVATTAASPSVTCTIGGIFGIGGTKEVISGTTCPNQRTIIGRQRHKMMLVKRKPYMN